MSISSMSKRVRQDTDNHDNVLAKKAKTVEATPEERLHARHRQQRSVVMALREETTCPITKCTMEDPVTTENGSTYTRSAIENWLKTKDTDPVTNQRLRHTQLIPNHSLRRIVEALAAAPNWDEDDDEESIPPSRHHQLLWSEHLKRADAASASFCICCFWPKGHTAGCCSRCLTATTALLGKPPSCREEIEAALTPERVAEEVRVRRGTPQWADPEEMRLHAEGMIECASKLAMPEERHRKLMSILRSHKTPLGAQKLAELLRDADLSEDGSRPNPLVTAQQASAIAEVCGRDDASVWHVLGSRTVNMWELPSTNPHGVAHCYYGTKWDPEDMHSIFNKREFVRLVENNDEHRRAAILASLVFVPMRMDSTWGEYENNYALSKLMESASLSQKTGQIIAFFKRV